MRVLLLVLLGFTVRSDIEHSHNGRICVVGGWPCTEFVDGCAIWWVVVPGDLFRRGLVLINSVCIVVAVVFVTFIN